MKIKSKPSEIPKAVNKIISSLEVLGLEEHVIFRLRLALEEAILNAIQHGNNFNPKLEVKVDFWQKRNELIFTVEDEGEGFDYKNLPDPTQEINRLKTSGRGIFLIRNIMDKIEFNEKGNRITMTKLF